MLGFWVFCWNCDDFLTKDLTNLRIWQTKISNNFIFNNLKFRTAGRDHKDHFIQYLQEMLLECPLIVSRKLLSVTSFITLLTYKIINAQRLVRFRILSSGDFSTMDFWYFNLKKKSLNRKEYYIVKVKIIYIPNFFDKLAVGATLGKAHQKSL